MPADMDYDEDPLGYGDEDEFDYSDEAYNEHYGAAHGGANGYDMPPEPGNKKSKKKRTTSLHQHSPYNPELLGNDMPPMPNPPPPPAGSMQRMHRPGRKETIWNTSSSEERQNIKDFWLSLTEEQRKSLLKIEKDAVLRKMKQQQKSSCSCTVCGRKRTAIEEELEVLYEGYYEELETYAHHDHPPFQSADGMVPDPLQHRPPHPLGVPPPQPPHHHHHHHHHHHSHRTSHVQEHFDDDEYSEDEDEEEEYSDEEYSDEDAEEIPRNNMPNDFFNFGQNLTVKGILTPWLERLQHELKGSADNLLTVADDLLKNDGRKFIEMMEQLAERRMHREETAEYNAANPSHPGAYQPGDHYHNEDPLTRGDEFDDDDEASYDSQEDFDEDYDDVEDPVCVDCDRMGGELHLTDTPQAMDEEERVKEGRRMFQIFAARMFEQRVLTAYKEKVAQERQQKLLEELEDESKTKAQREEKKQRDAQKKKDKKKQQKQAKDEAKAKQEAEKAAEEARVREAEEKKQEEQRRKKEEQRRKKEEEKRKVDEERARKDAEKLRRQQEEQQRREEVDRKAREQKAKKDEAKKREREEREAREKEARERKAQEEKEKREREAKAKTDKASQQAAQPPIQPQQIQKRPSQPGMVAVPGVYPKQTGSGISSPHPSIATPVIPKAPTPAKQRQASQQGSLASSPKQSTSQVSSVPSKSSSPNSAGANQPQAAQPKAILQKAGNQQANPPQPQQPLQSTSPNLQQPIQPPPGMPHPQHQFMQPMGFPGFQGPQGPMHQQMHMGQRGPMPMYPPQHGGPPMGMQSRFGHPPVNGMPPGFVPPQQQGRGMGYPPFDMPGAGQPPPGFGPPQQPQQQQVTPPIGPPATSGAEVARPMASHSRQPSASEKERFESAANQPIARPAPIQRPSSVKPHSQERRGSNTDLDDLSKHLGSSALLDDSDEPLSANLVENRRQSNLPPGNRTSQAGGMAPLGGAPIGGFGPPGSGFGGPGSWNAAPFGQPPGLGQHFGAPGMNMNMNSWNTNNTAFAANSFGTIGGSHLPRPGGPGGLNRPLTIRLAVCQACKQLSQANRGEGDGFHDVAILLRQIDANRPNLDAPPSLTEIEEICETEGDAQNGGGELSLLKGGETMSVKWAPDATTPDQGRGLAGLGEIGSPMPSKTSPSFGAPGSRAPGGGFASLGAVGSGGF